MKKLLLAIILIIAIVLSIFLISSNKETNQPTPPADNSQTQVEYTPKTIVNTNIIKNNEDPLYPEGSYEAFLNDLYSGENSGEITEEMLIDIMGKPQ